MVIEDNNNFQDKRSARSTKIVLVDRALLSILNGERYKGPVVRGNERTIQTRKFGQSSVYLPKLHVCYTAHNYFCYLTMHLPSATPFNSLNKMIFLSPVEPLHSLAWLQDSLQAFATSVRPLTRNLSTMITGREKCCIVKTLKCHKVSLFWQVYWQTSLDLAQYKTEY